MSDRTCVISDCPAPPKGRGYCACHYSRLMRYGDPHSSGQLKACVWCGREFRGRGRQVCCTVECRQASFRVYARDYQSAKRIAEPKPLAPRVPTPCEYCGEVFGATKRRSRYCSDACRAIDRHRANWRHLNARRARLRGAFVESFDRREIFERDQWVCQLCKVKIDKTLQWPNPMSASLDHIVPISRDGEHSRANAQASHLTCNVRKGDRVA